MKKTVIWSLDFSKKIMHRGRGYPTSQTCVLKSHLLPSMWPVCVEFRSASSEGRGEKKKIEVLP